jgi:hypothetical protein
MREGAERTDFVRRGGLHRVEPQAFDEPLALVAREPWRGLGTIGQHGQRRDAEHDRRNSLQYEEPLPAGEPETTVESQYPST